MEVREEHLLQVHEADRAQELALGALAAVEQELLAAATDQGGREAAPGCGRRAGGAEEDDVEVHQLTFRWRKLMRPPAVSAIPIVCFGWRRRSVGLPGLKIWNPSGACSCRGMCEWPKTTACASGKRSLRRSSRRVLGPASWSMAMRAPSGVLTSSASGRVALRSGESTFPCTAFTGGPMPASSSTTPVVEM